MTKAGGGSHEKRLTVQGNLAPSLLEYVFKTGIGGGKEGYEFVQIIAHFSYSLAWTT